MSVRIRLRRVGRKKQPSYRIVVAHAATPRGGVYLDNVGFYNPRRDPIELKVDLDKVDQWVAKGATMTPTVASLVRKARRGESQVVASAAGAAPEAQRATEEAPAPVAEAPAAAAEMPEAAQEAASAASQAVAGAEAEAESGAETRAEAAEVAEAEAEAGTGAEAEETEKA